MILLILLGISIIKCSNQDTKNVVTWNDIAKAEETLIKNTSSSNDYYSIPTSLEKCPEKYKDFKECPVEYKHSYTFVNKIDGRRLKVKKIGYPSIGEISIQTVTGTSNINESEFDNWDLEHDKKEVISEVGKLPKLAKNSVIAADIHKNNINYDITNIKSTDLGEILSLDLVYVIAYYMQHYYLYSTGKEDLINYNIKTDLKELDKFLILNSMLQKYNGQNEEKRTFKINVQKDYIRHEYLFLKDKIIHLSGNTISVIKSNTDRYNQFIKYINLNNKSQHSLYSKENIDEIVDIEIFEMYDYKYFINLLSKRVSIDNSLQQNDDPENLKYVQYFKDTVFEIDYQKNKFLCNYITNKYGDCSKETLDFLQKKGYSIKFNTFANTGCTIL